jgi:hypothetical protein
MSLLLVPKESSRSKGQTQFIAKICVNAFKLKDKVIPVYKFHAASLYLKCGGCCPMH